MKIRTFKSEAMVLSQKWAESSLQVGSEVLSQVEFKFLNVLFIREGRMEREIDLNAASAAWQTMLVHCGEEGDELKDKAPCVLVGLRSYLQL